MYIILLLSHMRWIDCQIANHISIESYYSIGDLQIYKLNLLESSPINNVYV